MMDDEMQEFLLYLMPLINIDRIRNYIRRRFIPRRKTSALHPSASFSISTSTSTSPTSGTNSASGDESQRRRVVENSVCPACQSAPPNVPYMTNCGHLYCYFCVLLLVHQEGGEADCLLCNSHISQVSRFQVVT